MEGRLVGPYRLEAALPGFRTYAQTGIVLQVNASPLINVTLEVGQVSESIEVEANATLVEGLLACRLSNTAASLAPFEPVRATNKQASTEALNP